MKNTNTLTEKRLNRKNCVIAMAAVAVMAIAGISAYLMDTDTVTDTFTVGNVDIQITQESYKAPTEGEKMFPNQEISMDPAVKNKGDNPVYAFIEVTVPYENIRTVSESGKVSTNAADTALFSYGASNSWIKVVDDEKDTTAKTMRRVYAYGSGATLKTLAVGAETEKLFSKLRFVNTLENEVINNSTRDVTIKGIAVQTQTISNGSAANAWAIVSKQLETQVAAE